MTSRSSRDVYAETLAVFDRREHRYEPLTTPEVADALDAKRRTVYKRLQKLVDRGKLETKETGSNSRVWWRPATGSTTTRQSSGRRQAHVTYQEVFETIPDGVTLRDPADGTIVDANQQYCEMLGYTREELLALDFEALHADVPPHTTDRAKRHIERAATEGPQTFEWLDETKDGRQLPVEVHLRRTTIDDEDRILAVVRDITDRKDRERELRETAQQLQAILDTVEASLFMKDTDGQYLLMNQTYRELVGVEGDGDEAVVGLTDEDLFPADVAAQFRADDERVLETNETIEVEEEIPAQDGTRTHLTRKTPVVDETGDPYAVCGVSTDITARKERERGLRAARRFNEELVENAPFGMFRLDEELRFTYENPRAEEIIGLPDDESASAAIGVDIRELPPIVETGQADLFTRLKDGETIEFEFPFESIYGREAYFTGRGVPLYRAGEFDGALLMVTDISERRRHEHELERQRDRLTTLDHLNDVGRGITRAVIDQSSRDEIEQVVCDRLAASDSYRFAWLCAVDSNVQLELRAEAGVDGYFDEIPLSADPDDPIGRGPTGRAVRTHEMQVVQNVDDDSSFEPWREYARAYGFRSAAAIPLVHRDTLYGVLGVYSERPDAFAEEERAVIGQLGEVIGHAIAALDRKRALMSEEVVELEIRIPRLLESRGISMRTDGTITVERTVPLGDDEYLMYGTATADAMAVLHALCEQLSGWTAVRTVARRDDEVRFEQHLSDPPMPSIVADHGGHFRTGRIENGTYDGTVHLPPGTDVRRVVDRIREPYPNVETISRQQVTREEPSQQRILSVLSERLTERQRAALEAGYFGGFFEWPRTRSGEDVAESLDIGPSTFHQHVRKAEKKLLDVVFAETR